MKLWALVATGAVVLALTAPLIFAENTRADVERVQKALKAQGHDPGPVDGIIGPQTSAALKAYQEAQGLSATGHVDDATLATLGGPGTRATGSTRTGGDTRPSAVDPAQGTKTGANVGEGALSTVKER